MNVASVWLPVPLPASTTSAREKLPVQAVAREDVELVYKQMNEDVWNCSQCFSCDRCPRGQSPGGLITIMREVAVKNGLHSAKEALEGYSRIVYKIMSTGTQVSPDMLQPDSFPDWGPEVKDVSDRSGSLATRYPTRDTSHHESAWVVDEKTLTELYLIWHMTGVLDMIKEIDEGLHMILQDVMEEALEEKGYSV